MFESCHLDQEREGESSDTPSLFCLCVACSMLVCEANASSHSPLGDRGACSPGAERANSRRRRVPCHHFAPRAFFLNSPQASSSSESCHLDRFGSEKRFSEPYSLITEAQYLRLHYHGVDNPLKCRKSKASK